MAIENTYSQFQCDELLLVGVSVYETLLEMHSLKIAGKLRQDAFTKAIFIKKETYSTVS